MRNRTSVIMKHFEQLHQWIILDGENYIKVSPSINEISSFQVLSINMCKYTNRLDALS